MSTPMFLGNVLREAAQCGDWPQSSYGHVPAGPPALDRASSPLAKATGAGGPNTARSEMPTVKQLSGGRNNAQQRTTT